MNIQEIRELIQTLLDSGIAELEVQRGEDRVKIKRGGVSQEVYVPQAAPAQPMVMTAAPDFYQTAGAPPPLSAPSPAPMDEGLTPIKSPIVGTFYSSPSPDSPKFANVGEVIRPGQVLCIVESMKLMNEIEAEIGGTVVKCLVENGSPVEYGQTMFLVKPH